MSARSSILTYGQRRASVLVERIPPYQPLVRTPIKAKLDRCTRLPVRYESTVISPSGSLIAACVNDGKVGVVRLYSVTELVNNQKIRVKSTLELRKERILDVALSDDLLVILTFGRILVYEHTDPRAFENRPVDEIPFGVPGQDGWTPQSISMHQARPVTTQGQTTARIVVGGERNEVRVFTYSHLYRWNRREGRAELFCSDPLERMGSIRLVGFSPPSLSQSDQFMVVGVSTANHVYCWSVDLRHDNSPLIECGWKFDSNPDRGKAATIGRITSSTLFASPSGKPYLFCTVDQRGGSAVVRSFISPIEMSNPSQPSIWDQLRVLPHETEGGIAREVFHGTATPNGLFLVAVEENRIRILAIQGSYQGGLTCRKNLSNDGYCKSSLIDTDEDVSAISIHVKEYYGRLEIVAVDGRGHVIALKTNIRDMPPASALPTPVTRGDQQVVGSTGPIELNAGSTVGELDIGESSRRSGSSASGPTDESG
ncbi:hypothetical protein P154DRAFT_610853 [Amniculicola lignicola CBS 123094]|uniref:WD40 repeat-like protein n=1 Tax=Amniculicola lignicola CBS 123094 TaxID=1392246 RepID=A0A6A5WCW7_9PLEO|nr:hypothetical protein P154DRAFT_610853 [Amniculicola lignicola CBS 123094]